jgi:hypothetical protein
MSYSGPSTNARRAPALVAIVVLGAGSITSGPNIPICTCSGVLTWQW